MEKSALSLEKVWFDKPFYEKAERLYYQQMAKVVSRKIMESCTFKSEVPVTNNYQHIINSTTSLKKKNEKPKDNKSFVAENVSNDILKGSKCQIQTLNSKKAENACNVPKKENIEDKHKHDGVKCDIQETNPSSDRSNKCNAKEDKEKKNKSDSRHNNKGKGKNHAKEVKENVTPLTKNKQQLPNQQLVQGNQQTGSPILPAGGSLANEVAKARQHIKQSLQCMDDIAAVAGFAAPNDAKNIQGNLDVYSVFQELRNAIDKLEQRVSVLEERTSSDTTCPYIAVCPAKPTTAPNKSSEKDENEDVDLFGSDSEGEDLEAAKIREERLAAYNAKKSKKPAIIAKSNIILDVKPWGDTTDMKAMESEVRKIEIDGLLWGAAKLVPLAFGIHKLQISCVVEDDKVSVDWLTEQIQDIEDHVQSVDIAAFNKV